MSAYPMTCNLQHVRRLGASTGSRPASLTSENKGPGGGPGGWCETVQKPHTIDVKWVKSPELPRPPSFNGLFTKIQESIKESFAAASTKPLNGIQDGAKLAHG